MGKTYCNFAQAQQQLVNIEAIDYFFAKEMMWALNTRAEPAEAEPAKISAENMAIVYHLFMALSVSLRAGHTCLPITEVSRLAWGKAYDEQGQCSHEGFTFPNADTLSILCDELALSASAKQPIVFENNKLYIRRYYHFECQLAHDITKRLQNKTLASLDDISVIIKQLFPPELFPPRQAEKAPQHDIDWQKIAVANSINKNFTVIAGGPGTGKTYTVTKLLAALLMLHNKYNHSSTVHIKKNQTLEIALVAPTGKAARRLSESIIKAIAGFKGLIHDDILSMMPTQAKTIHRLLGVIPNSPNFRHNQDNLLSCDVLLIDEVSMVDLPMMARIFRALKPRSRIILLGDADQLPSVSVGSVLADIAPRPHCGYSDENLNYLSQVCQLNKSLLNSTFVNDKTKGERHHDHLSFLLKSRRFDGEGGIGKLAAHVIQGAATQSWQLLASSTEDCSVNNTDVNNNANEIEENQLALVDSNLTAWLSPLVKQYYQGIAQCGDISDAFSLLAKFRVLCVTRQGELGVDAINQWIKNLLINGVTNNQTGYHGMPIMINENDYRLGLFNGDIGLLWKTNDGQLMAYFETTDQPQTQNTKVLYKILLPSRLPKYDTVYAMTIHKTQGSEFEHVAMVLPKQAEHQLLSRELLYTGITRAKKQLTISSNRKTWQCAVETGIKRYSGLTL
ncbi:exodeoxyribonuclease V subunit alpha [Colwellia sp. MSW7]|uniref:RecBCD enzyme subunit RecD n=1 Tax=Colwellia maritima TaxID=2912588 RepID=A0ABS9X231_9GAMM|nr:exodeoxyribonuclease V subunit alpha [Colwellia maritima]MCI2284300.1 exodeoxyribonuclease V subunit alpha [Colwellia maritima]